MIRALALLLGLAGCDAESPAAAKAPSPAQAPQNPSQEFPPPAKISSWDALQRYPVVTDQQVWIMRYPDVRGEYFKVLGEEHRRFLVAVWREFVREGGIPEKSLGWFVHSPQGDLVQCSLAAGEIERAMAKRALVPGTEGRAKTWKKEGEENARYAFADGWIAVALEGSDFVRKVLDVVSGKAKSFAATEGLAESVQEVRCGEPAYSLVQMGSQNPQIIVLHDTNLKTYDLAYVVQCPTEELARLIRKNPQFENQFGGQGQIENTKFEMKGSRIKVTGRGFFPEDLPRNARKDLAVLTGLVEKHKERRGSYPTTAEGLAALRDGASLDYFFGELPKDPWGRPYLYQFPHPTKKDTFDLRSVGPDGSKDTLDDIWTE